MEKQGVTQVFSLKISVLLTGLGMALLSSATYAAQAPLSVDSPYMSGDWNGYRTQLKNDGADFQISYTLESAANFSGGYHPATSMRYTDQWAFGTTLDLDKLLNWKDARFQLTITDRNGQDLSQYINDPRTGGLSSVQEVWGRGQTWRLTQFWLQQGLLDNRVEAKVGRVTVGEDFASVGDSLFQNLAFGGGQPGNWRGDRWYNWPVSQWGGHIRLNLLDDMFFQLGFYNQNPANYNTGNGFRLDTSHSEGNLIPAELVWQPGSGPQNLKGNYRIGGYYSSVNSDAYDSYHSGGYHDNYHSWGGWLILQQQLTTMGGDNSRGLGVRLQYVRNDHNTSKIDNYQSLALTWSGPFAARPEDEVGFGVARIHVNSDYTNMQRRVNAENGISDYHNPGWLPLQDGSEWNYELYYNLKATNWLNLRPNLQYVATPGAVDQVKNAFIGGIAGNINF